MAVTVSAASAAADQNDGAFRLSLQGVLFESRSLILEPSEGDGESVDVVDKTSGLLPSNLGLATAYGLSDRVSLGANLMFGSTEHTVGDDIESTKATSYQVVPFVEVGLASGDVRPFLSGGLGLWGGSAEAADEEVGSWSGYLFGASFGIQLFAAQGFSVDPAVSAYLVRGSYDLLDASYDQTGTNVFMSVSLTGWMGGSSSAASSNETATGTWEPSGSTRANEPGAPPVPSAVRESRDILTTTFPVGPDGAVASLIAREQEREERVLIQVRMPTTTPKLNDCKELAFEMKQGELEASDLRYEAKPTWEALRGSIATDSLGHVAESGGELALRTCGQYWKLTEDDRNRIYAFYVRAAFDETPSTTKAEGVRDRRGLLSAAMDLEEDVKVIVRGRPRTAKGEVALRVHVTTPVPRLGSCRELTLRTGNRSFALRDVQYGETKRANFSIEALEGRLYVDALVGAAQADRLEVDACGRSWRVRLAQRKILLRYAKAFQQRTPSSAQASEAESTPESESEPESTPENESEPKAEE